MARGSQQSPLTKENISATSSEVDTLCPETPVMSTRYYSDISIRSSLITTSSTLSQRQGTSQRSARYTKDSVMALPRSLAFPYHNDSLFLPTAEHHQRVLTHSCSSGSVTSLSTAQSCPILRNKTSLPMLPPPRRALSNISAQGNRQRSQYKTDLAMREKLVAMSWWQRLVCVFKRKAQKNAVSAASSDSPVWFQQYAANPLPSPALIVATA